MSRARAFLVLLAGIGVPQVLAAQSAPPLAARPLATSASAAPVAPAAPVAATPAPPAPAVRVAAMPAPAREPWIRALRAYRAQQFDRAAAAFREAAAAGAGPQAVIGVAAASRANGDKEGALVLYRDAEEQSVRAGDARSRLQALHGVASTLEALGRWEDALTAWHAYVRFADAASAADAQVGRQHLAAIRTREAAEEASAQIRMRTDERRRRPSQAPAAATPNR